MTVFKVLTGPIKTKQGEFTDFVELDDPKTVQELLALKAIAPTSEETLPKPNGLGFDISDPPPPPPSGSPTIDKPEKPHLNTAPEEELKAFLIQLDGIGEATASRLISSRPYETMEQAQKASGLSNKQWNEISDKFVL